MCMSIHTFIYIGPACRLLTWCEAGLSCIVDAVFYRSSVLQGVFLSFMDSSVPLLFGSFIAGWLARDWVIPKNPEPQACKCHCNCNTTSAGETSSWNVGAVFCGLVAVGLLVIFSNAALALRFSYKDTESGRDREVVLGVKGKSKGGLGVYGVTRGLQITD